MAKIISGKQVSEKILNELKEKTDVLGKNGIIPGLAVIIAGDDPASKIYVGNKVKTCERLGIYSQKYEFPYDVTQAELTELIKSLNNDPKIHGILTQLPLPAHIDEQEIINTISPAKDVDVFHPENVGRVMRGDYVLLPCTPAGIMELIKESGINIEGSECVIVGRSNIVGKPMAMLLLHQNGTVTIAHSRTKNLPDITRRADILIAAVGRANFITADMVKPGAVVIDVGINRTEGKRIVGDVDFDEVSKVAGAITPVPGGVGLMTIAMLMSNTVIAASSHE